MFNNLGMRDNLSVSIEYNGICYFIDWKKGESVFCYDGLVTVAKSF